MTVTPMRRSRALLVTAFSLAGLITAMAPVLPSAADVDGSDPGGRVQLEKIDGQLRQHLDRASASSDRIEAVVVLDDAAQTPVGSPTRRVATALEATAQSSQAPVVDAIRAGGDRVVNTFWIKNMILARLRPDTLRALTRYDRVERIIPNFKVWTTSSPTVVDPETQQEGESTWGIEKIGANDIHSELGVTGAGVRVAVLDTGVDIGHPDLAGKMVTDDAADSAHPGGWMEFSETGQPVPSDPYDSAWHGTHVSGTVVGGNASGTQIGVAPGADLMAGLVLPGGEGTFAQVLAGMQWTMAPFDADGNPVGAPADVVNMSLGAEGHFSELIEPTQNLYQAGIFPAFAVGNNCAPGRSHGPGNVYEAFSVGATDSNDNVAAFSCGENVKAADWVDPPAEWPDSYVVPDVSAPGVDVLSALPGGQYGPSNGTSMATPHVAGTAALMSEAEADITVDEAMEALTGTSFFDDRHGAERPNTRFGQGRIDAYAAVTEVALDGGVTGAVTDAGSGQPIAGAVVTRLDNGRATRTDEAGRFEMRLPAGTYRLEISHFGYGVRTLDVAVAADEFTEVGPELTPLPRHDVTGKVTYGPTGSRVPGATVELLDVPVELDAETRRNGTFTIPDVPEGDYQLAAHAPGLPRSKPVDVQVSSAQQSRQSHLVMPRRVRMSVGTDGTEGNEYSVDPSVSADGRYVAFYSVATNLVPDDTNGNNCGTLWPCGHDVFVHDRHTGETERVSVASDGSEGNHGSSSASISADGRYIAFVSAASNLVDGDTNGRPDVFVHDRRSGETERVSVASDGAQGDDNASSPSISADGRYVTFSSWASTLVDGDSNGRGDVFLHDRRSGETERVSVSADGLEANDSSQFATMSADGRYVAFESRASNLVADDTNGLTDVFVRDREAGSTERVSVASDGSEPNTNRGSTSAAISGDGRFVAWQSGASDLVPGDTNSRSDIFVHDRETRQTERVSTAFDGSQSDDNSSTASFSGDGRHLVFSSGASNLVPGDTNGQDDLFVVGLGDGTIERVSVAADGTELTAMSGGGAMSADGRFVAFQTVASAVEVGDTNQELDVFVHDRRPESPDVRFALSDLEVRPSVVRPGQRFMVTALVKNLGDAKGRYDAALRVDGAVEDEETLIVRPDETAVARFWLRRWDAGAHQVTVGPLTAEFTVRDR